MRREMIILEINNDETGDAAVGNYSYLVRIGRRVVREGRIEGHRRDEGWRSLLALIAKHEAELQERNAHERRRT